MAVPTAAEEHEQQLPANTPCALRNQLPERPVTCGIELAVRHQ